MRCFFCKKDIPKGEGYEWIHISKTGKQYKRHCCSLEEKEFHEREIELYRKVQLITDEILTYPCVNNNRNKRIKELQNAGYTNEQIFRCFKQYKEDIIHWINANGIDKEFNKLAYMFAVVGANIKDFTIEDERNNQWEQYKKEEEIIPEVEFGEIKEETDEEILNRLKNKKENKSNISSFLNNLK